MFSWAMKSFLPWCVAGAALALVGCQSKADKTLPDVPAAIGQGDLVRIDQALSAAPQSLAVFSEPPPVAPLDPARSGVIVDLDRQRAMVPT